MSDLSTAGGGGRPRRWCALVRVPSKDSRRGATAGVKGSTMTCPPVTPDTVRWRTSSLAVSCTLEPSGLFGLPLPPPWDCNYRPSVRRPDPPVLWAGWLVNRISGGPNGTSLKGGNSFIAYAEIPMFNIDKPVSH